MTHMSRVSLTGITKTSHLVMNHPTGQAYGVAIRRDPYTSTAYTMTGNSGMASIKPFPVHPANQGNDYEH